MLRLALYQPNNHDQVISAFVNSSGALYREKRYMPWGEERYANGTLPTTFHFTGQREQEELGLYFYQSRWYDQTLGRFIQPDTIIPDPYDSQSWDRYHYAGNNPLRFVDPSGHRTCTDQQAATGDETCDQNYPENDIDYVIHKILMGTLEMGPGGPELDPGDNQLPFPTNIWDSIVRAISLFSYLLKPLADEKPGLNVFVWLTYHEYEENISLYGINVNNYSDQTIYLAYVDISASTRSLPPEIINSYTIQPESRGYKSDYLATIMPSSSNETQLILGSPYACQYPTFSSFMDVGVSAKFVLVTNLAGVIAIPVEVTIPVP